MERALDMAGTVFFRVRSFAPLPVAATVGVLSWRSHVNSGWGGETVDFGLDFLGVALCLLGSLIRFYTVGFIPPGTSSQSRLLKAQALNVEGPYALVRHPLYLGNLAITLGLLCIAHEPWAWMLGLGYFAVSCALIIRAEEALLRRTFGARYEEWAARVPALLPSRWELPELREPFGWKHALQRELTPLVSWGMGATVLLVWELFARRQLTVDLARLAAAVLAGFLLVLLTNKVWKKVRPL